MSENFLLNSSSNNTVSDDQDTQQIPLLQPRTTRQTIKLIDKRLQDKIDGVHYVLMSRWEKLNYMLLGGFQFGQLYVIGGASGHGKSYLLNMLRKDFLNPKINQPSFDVKILHFGFEMSAEMELFRRISAATGIPFRKFVASDETLTDTEVKTVKRYYSSLKDDQTFFFEHPGTISQLEATIRNFQLRFPDSKLVITLDHTLLVTPEPGQDEIKVLSELGKMFIRLKKELDLMVLLLTQLNDKIEGEKRRDPTNPSLHFPTKTDLHGSKQLYHAADVVLVIHQPGLLNLEYYGRKNIPTKDLVALHMIKQRNGEQKYTLFKNELHKGDLVPWRTDEKAKEKVLNALNKDSKS